MADITINSITRNGSAGDLELVTGAASQTIDISTVKQDKLVIMFFNGDALDCRVKISAGGYDGAGSALDIDVTAAKYTYIVCETWKYKGTDGKLTLQVLDQDDTAFSGTVGNTKFLVGLLPD